MGKRLVKAADTVQAIVDEFERRYAHYVYGEPYFNTEDDRKNYYSRQGESSDAQRIKHGWDTTSFPLHGMHKAVMMPYMMARDPVFVNRQRLGADPLEEAQIDLFADVAAVIWKECQTTREVRRALEDAYHYRVGWVRTVYHPKLRLPVNEWVDARNMLVDCDTRSPRIEDRRWVAERLVLPIETAKWFAKNIWDNAKYDFEAVTFEAAHSEDSSSGGKRRARGSRNVRDYDETESDYDFTRIVMVEVKGENPYTMSANYAQKKMNDPAGKDDVYDGNDHVLILEARGGFMNPEKYKFIGRIDWPFPCKKGQFTYTPFFLTKDNRSFYPYSIMQPGHLAQVSADGAIQAFNTDNRNSARRWGAYSPSAFQDEKDAQHVIEGDEALPMVPVKNNQDPNKVIAVGNFGSPNPALNLAFAINRENFEAIQGMNKFDVQVRANQTALNTSIQNESAQVKIDDLALLVEGSVTELAEKAVMCARANMTNDDLAHWVKIPGIVNGEAVARARPKRDGGEEMENDLWPNDPDWDDIRREVVVNLEPRSIRFVNPDKEAQDIRDLRTDQATMARVIGDTAGKGAVGAAQEMARVWNESTRAICKLKNIANYERFMFDPEKILPPVPPPTDPNMVMQTAAQMMQSGASGGEGAVNPQTKGAASRVVGAGVNPESLPDELGAE